MAAKKSSSKKASDDCAKKGGRRRCVLPEQRVAKRRAPSAYNKCVGKELKGHKGKVSKAEFTKAAHACAGKKSRKKGKK